MSMCVNILENSHQIFSINWLVGLGWLSSRTQHSIIIYSSVKLITLHLLSLLNVWYTLHHRNLQHRKTNEFSTHQSVHCFISFWRGKQNWFHATGTGFMKFKMCQYGVHISSISHLSIWNVKWFGAILTDFWISGLFWFFQVFTLFLSHAGRSFVEMCFKHCWTWLPVDLWTGGSNDYHLFNT